MPCSRSLGGMPAPRGVPAPGGGDPPHQQTATVVGGTHPTGMHSCLKTFYFLLRIHSYQERKAVNKRMCIFYHYHAEYSSLHNFYLRQKSHFEPWN